MRLIAIYSIWTKREHLKQNWFSHKQTNKHIRIYHNKWNPHAINCVAFSYCGIKWLTNKCINVKRKTIQEQTNEIKWIN